MGVAQKVTELVKNTIEEMGFELVDAEYVKEGRNQVLRLYVDKEGGINIDECETVSRATEVLIDEANIIDNSYIFEVSSPGIDRPFKTDRDYEKAIGQQVEITLFAPMEGTKRIDGVLKEKDGDTVTIETGKNREIKLDRKQISQIRKAVIF